VDISALRPERFAEGKLTAGPHLYKPRRDQRGPALTDIKDAQIRGRLRLMRTQNGLRWFLHLGTARTC